MAKFRNVDKRRPGENKEQKRRRSNREKEQIEHEKHVRRILGYRSLSSNPHCFQSLTSSLAAPIAPRLAKEETWAEYFGLKFYRFQKWLQSLWAAARFQRADAWIPADRLR